MDIKFSFCNNYSLDINYKLHEVYPTHSYFFLKAKNKISLIKPVQSTRRARIGSFIMVHDHRKYPSMLTIQKHN